MTVSKSWIAPSLATIILAVFVLGSAFFYNQVQEELRKKESSVVAKAIALNLVNEIKSVARVLNGLSQIESVSSASKIDLYNKISHGLIDRYPGFFYGINFINSDGIIEKIYPVEGNQRALGRNLMERPELKPYLLESIKNQTTMMSHRVITYQGIYAVIIYEPLYDTHKQFKGWVNAVIDIDVWLNQQLASEGWKDIYIHMHWEGHNGNDFENGKISTEHIFNYDFKVLNQTIKMNVGLAKNSLSSLHHRLLAFLELLGVFLLILVSFLLFKLTISQNKLITANQQLNFKNILLNSLAHDVSNPLTSLGMVIEQVASTKEASVSESGKQRAVRSLNILNEMLASVKALSRLEMEKEDFKTKPVSIKQAVNSAIESVKEQAERKNILLTNQIKDDQLAAQADESTLINNVIPNVFNNAIKFTKPKGVITVTSEETNSHVWICISDQGGGFTEDEIQKFNSGKSLKTSLGSEGEVGSGLGLTQVKGFMELYGGEALLGNSENGALIKLKFKKARI